jgi:hypothetical protein
MAQTGVLRGLPLHVLDSLTVTSAFFELASGLSLLMPESSCAF